jgi:hypothetical protein
VVQRLGVAQHSRSIDSIDDGNNFDVELGNVQMMMMNRSESLAYPKTGTMAKINFLLRQNSRAVVATLAFVAFVLILSLDAVQRSSTGAGMTSTLRNM